VQCWGDNSLGQAGSLMSGDVGAVAPLWDGSF
jgi:hypothetical protein